MFFLITTQVFYKLLIISYTTIKQKKQPGGAASCMCDYSFLFIIWRYSQGQG